MSPSSPAGPGPEHGPGGEEGLVLLEILVALAIFTYVVLAWVQSSDSAVVAAVASNRERTLRLLLARKLDEVRLKRTEYREGGESGFEEESAEGEENPFKDYVCRIRTTRVVAAGRSDEDDAIYLFAKDEDDEGTETPKGAGPAPEPVVLLQFRLTVEYIGSGDEEEDDALPRRISASFLVPAPEEDEGR